MSQIETLKKSAIQHEKKKRGISPRRKTELMLLLFMLPAILVVVLFVVVPSIWAIWVSFTNQSLVGPSAQNPVFIGIANYIRLFKDPTFWSSLRISAIFVIGSAFIGQFIIGLALAVFLKNMGVVGRFLIGGSVLLAWVVPEMVAVYIWISMLRLDGVVDQLLVRSVQSGGEIYIWVANLFGSTIEIREQLPSFFQFKSVQWLIKRPLLSIILANTWRGTAFSMLLFSSALETIPPEIYDAADVDGANGWRKFRHITLPMIRYTILLDIIILTMGTFAVFGLAFALTPSRSFDNIIGVFIYRNAFQFRDIGYGSAASVIMLLINLILAVFYLRFLKVDLNKPQN